MNGSGKIFVPLTLNSKFVKMEFDSEAAISVITLKDYKRVFSNSPVLKRTTIQLKTYTNELL